MEIGVLRQMMKRRRHWRPRGPVWSTLAEDVKMDREGQKPIAQVLTADEKKLLFGTAASNPKWTVVYCAGVLAISTTCRRVELKHLGRREVNLLGGEIRCWNGRSSGGSTPALWRRFR